MDVQAKIHCTGGYSYRLCKPFFIIIKLINLVDSNLTKELTLWGLATVFSFARLSLLRSPTFKGRLHLASGWFGKPGTLECTHKPIDQVDGVISGSR